MTPEERASGEGPVDLGSWSEVLPPDDDTVDALGWQEVRGALVILGIAVLAFAVAGLVVL